MNSKSNPTYREANIGKCQRQKDTIHADGACHSQRGIIGEKVNKNLAFLRKEQSNPNWMFSVLHTSSNTNIK